MNILQTVTGRVVEGAKVGRTLGFPTINLAGPGEGGDPAGAGEPSREFDLPFGVYSGVARTPHGNFKAAIHYGVRHGGGKEHSGGGASRAERGERSIGRGDSHFQEVPVLEAHLLDCDLNFYGETVSIDVYTKIRDVKKFEHTEALKKQIAQDVEWVRHNQPIV